MEWYSPPKSAKSSQETNFCPGTTLLGHFAILRLRKAGHYHNLNMILVVEYESVFSNITCCLALLTKSKLLFSGDTIIGTFL